MTTERAAADAPSPQLPATLQAVLQFEDGDMESVAVPVPLPSVIVRVRRDGQGPSVREQWCRRSRSSDSVVRYVEETAITRAASRSCSHCGEGQAMYFVPNVARETPLDTDASLSCERCLSRLTSRT